jgi:hypothetical protein
MRILLRSMNSQIKSGGNFYCFAALVRCELATFVINTHIFGVLVTLSGWSKDFVMCFMDWTLL